MRFGFAVMAAVFIPLSAMAQESAAGFSYKGKPIDPVCVQIALESGGRKMAPERFGVVNCPAPERMSESENRFVPDAGGFTGFKLTHGGFNGMSYFQYRVAGVLKNGDYLIEIMRSGGGSGTFTSVHAVDYDGVSIEIKKNYAGGDRCNGGIGSASVENGAAVYRYWATPAELTQIFLDTEKYKPYKDLESGASSCAGEIEGREGEITALIFDRARWAEKRSVPGWTGNYPYQKCFDDYIAAYLRVPDHDASLAPDAAAALIKGFDKTCGAPDADKEKGGRS